MATDITSHNVQQQNISKSVARFTDLPDELVLRLIILSGDKPSQVKIAYILSSVCSRFRQLLLKQFLPSIQQITPAIISPLSLANAKLACTGLTSMFSHTTKVKEINLGGLPANLLTQQCFSALANAANNTLTKVDLGYCTVSDSCVQPLLSCSNLRRLSLPSCNNITGSMFLETDIKAPLEFLDFSCATSLTEEGFRAIAQISTIKELTLAGCYNVRRRTIQSFLSNDIRKSLEVINLAYCTIQEDSLAELLERAPNLRTLVLAEQSANLWGTGEFTLSAIELLKDRFSNVNIILKV